MFPYLKYVSCTSPSSTSSCPFIDTSVHTYLLFNHIVLSNADFLYNFISLQTEDQVWILVRNLHALVHTQA